MYVPNGRGLDHDHYQYKLAWLARLRGPPGGDDDAEPRRSSSCGDFNIAPDDIDVYDPAKFVGATHVSPPEREALAALEALGSATTSSGAAARRRRVFSWWDYRAGDFHQGRGMRIDLVLASAPVAARVAWCVIDRNARKGKQPSDHAPVVVDLDWPAA